MSCTFLLLFYYYYKDKKRKQKLKNILNTNFKLTDDVDLQ